MIKRNNIEWNIQFFADGDKDNTDPGSPDQDSAGQGPAGEGGAVLDNSDLDALTKVLQELTAQNKALVKELSEVKAANLRLAAQMDSGGGEPKTFEEAFKAAFDYGQNRKE